MKAWRSTDKLLPEIGVLVLAVHYKGFPILAEWDGDMWIDDHNHTHYSHEITYWMPIPILPNE